MQTIQYKPLDQFVDDMTSLYQGESDIVGRMDLVLNGETFPFLYTKNAGPRFYTCIDDTNIIFDSVDLAVDDTLQKNKVIAYGSVYKTFSMEDDFIPAIDPSMFPYLIAKAKTRCFNDLKQIPNAESAAEARTQKIVQQKRKRRVQRDSEFQRLPKYGRH
jgi:hypothetical protein